MFVKIVFRGLGIPSETLIQCDKTHSCERPTNKDVPSGIIDLILSKNGQPDREWVIDKSEHEVYFMNDEGRTIDMWRWCEQANRAA